MWPFIRHITQERKQIYVVRQMVADRGDLGP